MVKPEKFIYDNQEEVYDLIITYVRSQVAEVNCEAYLVGSATEGKFGKYSEPYEGHLGSDIDLIVFLGQEVPSNWIYLHTDKRWWKLYRVGELEVNETPHKLEALVVKQGQEDLARKRMIELGWVVEKIK